MKLLAEVRQMNPMTPAEYDKATTVLILKYGSIEKAIDYWLETDVDAEDFDMLDYYLSQPIAKDK